VFFFFFFFYLHKLLRFYLSHDLFNNIKTKLKNNIHIKSRNLQKYRKFITLHNINNYNLFYIKFISPKKIYLHRIHKSKKNLLSKFKPLIDTNSWIYSKHKIPFELQSKFFIHASINHKPRDWLPPYKEKTFVRIQ
jgi:hypothetical protein